MAEWISVKNGLPGVRLYRPSGRILPRGEEKMF